MPQLGVDEKAFRKGHKYITLVNDLERSRVLYVGEDRSQASLDGFYGTLTEAQRDSIQAIAIDMWDPYLASIVSMSATGVRKSFTTGSILQNIWARRWTRCRARRIALRERRAMIVLTGTRYDWLPNPVAMEPADRKAFAELRCCGLKTAINKQGNGLMRTLLVESAQSVTRLNPGFRKQYLHRCRLMAKGVAKVPAARRLAVRPYDSS